MHAGNVLQELNALLRTDALASLGPERRAEALSIAELEERLGRAFESADLTPAVQNLFRSIVYLWHDHLDESHRIAQEIENQDGSLVHGIMHRREPDYSNAKYWFRRVGSHPSFLTLSRLAGELLARRDETDLLSRLLPNKVWDPFAFIDAVEDAQDGQFRSKTEILEEIQKLEFESLIENLVNRL